jgi:hypothetical protein
MAGLARCMVGPMDAPATLEDPREPDEDALVAAIEKTMRRQLEKDYPPAQTKRDAHPKHTGLLEAVFTVPAGLPAELRVGMFAEARSYKAWVRTSNASGKPQPDSAPDFRGFAIKVLDVPGDKIEESDEPRNQDFVLLSNPNMPLGTVRLFHDAIVLSTRFSPLLFVGKMLLTGQGHVLKGLAAGKILPSSPLEIRYWSTTPYRFGPDRAVKYSLLPTSGVNTPLPPSPGATYLTDAMEKRLTERKQEATFDFAVQLRKGDMPLDDSAPRWDETVSPFVKVASLTIPPQLFRTEERDRLAEALSFSPGHARVEHRPLAGVNRARMRVYRSNSDFRHQRSGTPKMS